VYVGINLTAIFEKRMTSLLVVVKVFLVLTILCASDISSASWCDFCARLGIIMCSQMELKDMTSHSVYNNPHL